MNKKIIIHSAVATALALILAPSLALALTNPTLPPGIGGQAVTAGTIERLINSVVNFLITISVVLAVGVIVYGGIETMRGGWDKGKTIITRGVIGVAIVLGVGLILSTVARFVNTGGSIN